MAQQRPPMVGRYQLLLDYECPDATVRIIRLKAGHQAVEQHLHHHTNQIYVTIEGEAIISNEGVDIPLPLHHATTVTRGSLHSARAKDGDAIVINISVPPLRPDDQKPAHPDLARNDLSMPSMDSDLED
ncbi:MAG: hypothetical protein IT303_03550 [Dehalococcoidia bacterium]|nr:hypothetical protein [Dehalococcoidia bacterium]